MTSSVDYFRLSLASVGDPAAVAQRGPDAKTVLGDEDPRGSGRSPIPERNAYLGALRLSPELGAHYAHSAHCDAASQRPEERREWRAPPP